MKEHYNWDVLPIDEDLIAKARPVRREIFLPEDLWSEILPGLWQGGTEDWDTVLETQRSRTPFITVKEFDTVITTYAWANPCDWLVKELRYGYYDQNDMKDIDFDTIYQLVDVAYADWKKGKRVLIRCQAGLNRSGLITALVLMEDGYTAVDAIALLRKNRSEFALCNLSFEDWLLGLDSQEEVS